MKSTAIAPANIAFVKYWGRTDDALVLPSNTSISMNLSACTTTTTVEFNETFKEDTVVIDFGEGFKEVHDIKKERVIAQLDRIRKLGKASLNAKIYSRNSFPAGNGIASSASAFAALTKACTEALEMNVDERDLTILTRLSGSGSACRSIPDGFVEWVKGDNDRSVAMTLYPPQWWQLVDIVVIVEANEKTVSSVDGHMTAKSSPFFESRLKEIEETTRCVKNALKMRDITMLGETIEKEALSMHAVMLTSTPPLLYWSRETIELINAVWTWRKEGMRVYFTIDAGSNIHLICEEAEKDKVLEKLKKIGGVLKTIVNTPAHGAKIVEEHLF